jgi:GntR family transcriptional repressor for pyruvate dehydrogenase complex
MTDGDTSLFQPVNRGERLTDRVASQLLESVLSGHLRPGERLPAERHLCEQFQVSRTVVREAVRSLTAKGVLTVVNGRLYVSAADASGVRESMRLFVRGNRSINYANLHEVREVIEVRAAGLAAQRATDSDRERLRAAFERLETAVREESKDLSMADVAFHRTVAELSHNELFPALLDSVGDLLLIVREQTASVPSLVNRALDEHRRIFDRILARDTSGAEAAMASHLASAATLWPLDESPG